MNLYQLQGKVTHLSIDFITIGFYVVLNLFFCLKLLLISNLTKAVSSQATFGSILA
jgi:hypothetical protein